MRIALGIEYLGTGFCGWQSQRHEVRTVQACVEKALSKVAGHPVSVICAGRTDTGVHATGQVIHFETEAVREDRAWLLGTTTGLPDDIGVSWVRQVADDFHARFSALSRRYRYVIANRESRPGLLNKRATWVFKRLDEARMHEAAQHLLGENDFSSYRGSDCQSRTPMRNVHFIEVSRQGDFVFIEIQANAFLHHMVRNIAGVLIEIGKGKRPADWSREVLEHRDRTRGGVTAPSDGLYLVGVDYPAVFGVPGQSAGPLFL